LLLALAATLLAVGCTNIKEPALPQVLGRAPKDLDCPGKKIHIDKQLGGRYRATGCGRTTTYQTACEGLQCSVGEVEESKQVWRDRPDPGSIEAGR
jgi:hypothetical protein